MTNAAISTRGFSRKGAIVGDNVEDTALLERMADDAEAYLKTFDWCQTIDTTYFAGGVGGIAALFLVEFNEPLQSSDQQLWIVAGDIPSAYFVTDEARNPRQAIRLYCQLMNDWANSVLNLETERKVFPVRADRTKDNALSLKERIEFIMKDIVPHL